MKHLALAFGTAVILALVIYAAGHALVSNDDLVKAAAVIPFAGCQRIAELLEKQGTKRALIKRNK